MIRLKNKTENRSGAVKALRSMPPVQPGPVHRVHWDTSAPPRLFSGTPDVPTSSGTLISWRLEGRRFRILAVQFTATSFGTSDLGVYVTGVIPNQPIYLGFFAPNTAFVNTYVIGIGLDPIALSAYRQAPLLDRTWEGSITLWAGRVNGSNTATLSNAYATVQYY